MRAGLLAIMMGLAGMAAAADTAPVAAEPAENSCPETDFSPEARPVFLEAEHAMFERRQPGRAAALLDDLALRGLSCFEQYPVSMLRTHAELAIRDPEFIYGENHAPPRLMPIFDLSVHPIVYPPEAEAAGVEGDCQVTFEATRSGETRRIRTACSNPLLEAAAEDHVRRSRFEPVMERGRAAVVRDAVLTFAFRLEPQDAKTVADYDRLVTTRP